MYTAPEVRLAGPVPWRWLLAAATALAAAGTLAWWLSRPETPFALGTCSTPEVVLILEDSSPSVIQADPSDRRMAAVQSILRHLRATPCTPDDAVGVISFTETQVLNGPVPVAQLGPIGRATGNGTDIAAAVGVAVDQLARYPSHRHIVIMLSDLQDRSQIPIDATMARLAGDQVVLVSIGNAKVANGVTRMDLDSVDRLTRQIGEVINQSRRRS